ncbi:uncharacterized protein LOC127831656 [Dreissena polymorpha]|uniref:uncharacterized protein LOC127831656 n=1 Tax=Dreissena polymorpha TaxID=45954 RepID=UPI00226492B4|nr:uncharacterized protein LOC127831656 [Dreissena polymorpha]
MLLALILLGYIPVLMGAAKTVPVMDDTMQIINDLQLKMEVIQLKLEEELKSVKQELLETKKELREKDKILYDHASIIQNLVSQSQQKGRGRRQVTEAYSFTAVLDHLEGTVHPGSVIKYNRLISQEGDMYNNLTGIVTIPMTGTYIFSFTIDDWASGQMIARLYVDGIHTVDGLVSTAGDTSQQAGNTAILVLNKGQSVWVQMGTGGRFYGDQNNFLTSFTGALLL